jgi:DNA-binding CsgD family transcriptional regulator/GAF domain-containing protein
MAPSVTQPGKLMQRALTALAARTGLPVAFGGWVDSRGAVLAAFVGARTGTLQGLLVEPGEGLGGLALARRRPAAASSYHRSEAITHRYDREVGGEGIRSLLAVPVVADGRVRALVYAGHRTSAQFGDAVLGAATAVARRLAWELAVHEEVQRRLAFRVPAPREASDAPGPAEGRAELAAVHAELRQIARSIPDPELAGRLESAAAMLLRPRPAPARPPVLSLRELDVVAHVALGKRNALIGTHLGLAESTVKSYLASATRKLEASGRHEAVVAARRLGLIP